MVDAERQVATWLEAGEPVAAWPVSTARGRHRRRGRLVPHAAGLAPHPAADRRGARAGTVFVSREPTGEMWRGEARDDDLILTRILTLDGLEDGVNRGPGCDSLARYIYLHGTNHEGRSAAPASHGCVRLANATCAELFDARRARATWWSSPRRKRGRSPIRRAAAASTTPGSAAAA